MTPLTFKQASQMRKDPYLFSLLQNQKKEYTSEGHTFSKLTSKSPCYKRVIEKIARLFQDLVHLLKSTFSKKYREKFLKRAEEIRQDKLFLKLCADSEKVKEKNLNFELDIKILHFLQGLKNEDEFAVPQYRLEKLAEQIRLEGDELDRINKKQGVVEKEKKKIGEGGALASMLEDIGRMVHPEIAKIWEIFFSKFGKAVVKKWFLHEGKFCLELTKQLKLWVPSFDEKGKENPKGGNVMILDKIVVIRMEKDTMFFDVGYWSYCKNPEFSFPEFVDPQMTKIVYKNSSEILFYGKKLGIEKPRTKTFDSLQKNWSEESVVVTDHVKVIKEKSGAKR